MGNGSQLRLGGQEDPRQGQGRNPQPLGDPKLRGNAPTHTPGRALGKDKACGPLTLRGSLWDIGAGAGDSLPTSRYPAPGGPEVMALHRRRPQPHLPHFLLLSHPLLSTLDFGTSCPRSCPLTCLPNLGVRLGKEGRCAWSGLTPGASYGGL